MLQICSILFSIFLLGHSKLNKNEGFGNEVTPTKFSFVGLLIDNNNKQQPICAVSLLNKNHALTSAACFCNFETGKSELKLSEDNYSVYFGLSTVSMYSIDRAEVKVTVKDIFISKNVSAPCDNIVDSTKSGDIAILLLSKEIKQTVTMRYIEILDNHAMSEKYTHVTTAWIPNDGRINVKFFEYNATDIMTSGKNGYFFGSIQFDEVITKDYSKYFGEPAVIMKNDRYFLKGFVRRPWDINILGQQYKGNFQYTMTVPEIIYKEKFYSVKYPNDENKREKVKKPPKFI